MNYPNEFKTLCKKVYPSWKDLHDFLDRGSVCVGRMLENALGLPLDEDLIIRHFRNKKPEKILEAAIFTKKKRHVYQEFIRIQDQIVEDNDGVF